MITFTIPEPRTGECRHPVAVLLNPEEKAALDKIMALRRVGDADAIGLALRLALPTVEAIATAPIGITSPLNAEVCHER